MRMEDKERLLRALNCLAEAGEKRMAQQEEERKKEVERAESRKLLYAQFYETSSSMTFYMPNDSALIDIAESK